MVAFFGVVAELWIIASFIITIAFLLSFPLKNAGVIDFAWPLSFTMLSLLIVTGYPMTVRLLIIGGMYVICGIRFMLGWISRTLSHGEDRRWTLWRESWNKGQHLCNPFGLRHYGLNLFLFFHAQSTATALSLIMPLLVVAENKTSSPNALSPIEIFAVILAVSSFTYENIADLQLLAFKKNRLSNNTCRVCKEGLWKYSRHPNYFGELGIWCSYVIYASSSLSSNSAVSTFIALASTPVTAYWFLVYFTGVPITEAFSVRNRGNEYRLYQKSTNMIFPGFPKKLLK